MDKAYVNAVNDPLSVKYENEIVEEITRETSGFLIFQEQIALLAHNLGEDISLDDANLLRKLLTKKGLDTSKQAKKEEIMTKFVRGCVNKGISKREAEDMWQKFEYFSGYGFNKSHAVAYSIISYQTAWLATYYNAEWTCAFLDKEPESRKEKAINIAKSWGYTIKPLNINTSGRRWTAADDTTLVAPLTTIKGLGDAAIDEIIEKRPFTSVEHLLFDGGVVARKLNKKSLDALTRASAMNDLIDDRFTGDKHFWSATVVDKPKSKKKLLENIETYKKEGSFTKAEIIQNTQTLTGIYPISMVLSDRALKIIDQHMVPPISEFDIDLAMAWCIPIKIITKKSKNGKWFHTIDVIDTNSVMTRIRCWGVDPNKDFVHLNKPYVIKNPNYNETWGFSTYGRVDKKWMMIG